MVVGEGDEGHIDPTVSPRYPCWQWPWDVAFTNTRQERGRKAGNPKPSHQLGFGSAVSNGGGERQWVVVGRLV